MASHRHFFARLLGTRPGWPYDMNAREEEIMREHSLYLQELTWQKKVLLAGPCFDNPVFGLAVLQTASEEEAHGIMKNDPSVLKGLHTFEIHPMRASFVAENLSAGRYVQDPSDKILRKDAIVAASRAAVWRAWTTSEGIRMFFGNDARLELRLGGSYEVYFLLENPYGLRGSEDCRIISYLPMEMLSFEWNAPPEFGSLRTKRTQVIVRLSDAGPAETKVTLSHLGWGKGEEWESLLDYFDRAWGHVLENLRKRFAGGPV